MDRRNAHSAVLSLLLLICSTLLHADNAPLTLTRYVYAADNDLHGTLISDRSDLSWAAEGFGLYFSWGFLYVKNGAGQSAIQLAPRVLHNAWNRYDLVIDDTAFSVSINGEQVYSGSLVDTFDSTALLPASVSRSDGETVIAQAMPPQTNLTLSRFIYAADNDVHGPLFAFADDWSWHADSFALYFSWGYLHVKNGAQQTDIKLDPRITVSQWNRYDLTVAGSEFAVIVNGIEVHRATLASALDEAELRASALTTLAGEHLAALQTDPALFTDPASVMVSRYVYAENNDLHGALISDTDDLSWAAPGFGLYLSWGFPLIKNGAGQHDIQLPTRVRVNQWNRYDVTVNGAAFMVTINGTPSYTGTLLDELNTSTLQPSSVTTSGGTELEVSTVDPTLTEPQDTAEPTTETLTRYVYAEDNDTHGQLLSYSDDLSWAADTFGIYLSWGFVHIKNGAGTTDLKVGSRLNVASWNKIELQRVGDRITLSINDELVYDELLQASAAPDALLDSAVTRSDGGTVIVVDTVAQTAGGTNPHDPAPIRVAPAQFSPLTTDLKVYFLNHQTLVVVGDYHGALQQRIIDECGAYLEQYSDKADWSYRFSRDFAALETAQAYRPELVARFADPDQFQVSDNDVIATSSWMNARGQFRFTDPYQQQRMTILDKSVAVVHFAYLTLASPLQQGQEYTVSSASGEQISFTYDETALVSRAIKVNQVGYHPAAGQKYAYLGMWLGASDGHSQSLDLAAWDGEPFELVDSQGQVAYSGTIGLRMADRLDQQSQPVNGETVYQLDFSTFNTPGEYRLRVAGMGNSWPFLIHEDALGEAFYTHTRGLYHKRCGTAKAKPYTQWETGVCHATTYQGGFLSDQFQDYPQIVSDDGNSDYSPFAMVADTQTELQLDVHGGWHDAADYDRRPYHMVAVQDLLIPYLLQPQKFYDHQLNIPESGNGIADILDEADWGMRVWLRAQQSDGSVGMWIEATSHPAQHNPALDEQRYYLAEATRDSTMLYAAYSALLARAYRVAGETTRENEYLSSAIQAYQWASNTLNGLNKQWHGSDGGVYHFEEGALDGAMQFKAALNLYHLTGDSRYRDDMAATRSDFERTVDNFHWDRSSFFYLELMLDDDEHSAAYRAYFAEGIITLADQRLQEVDNYAYRQPWRQLNSAWYDAMGWGSWHPLRRARVFVASHVVSGEQKYLDAAYLANDYQMGANPLGRSLTSGLGSVYPVTFLDLPSYADQHQESVPGITPYQLDFRIHHGVKEQVYGIKVDAREDHQFAGIDVSFIDGPELLQPIWRRFGNIEGRSVSQDEYTVWETISPAAGVTAYLMGDTFMPSSALKNRTPASYETLQGTLALP